MISDAADGVSSELKNGNDTVLQNHGFSCLYHFSSSDNHVSIMEHGLYSLKYILSPNGVRLNATLSSNELSRSLDTEKKYDDYVRLSLFPYHPMMYTAVKDGRLKQGHIDVFKISLDILKMPGVMFSNVNAASNVAKIMYTPEHFEWDVLALKESYRFIHRDKKPYRQAEILVPQMVSNDFITVHKQHASIHDKGYLV